MRSFNRPAFHGFRRRTPLKILLLLILPVALSSLVGAAPVQDTPMARDPAQFHMDRFTNNPYTGTASCLECHMAEAQDVLQTAHFKWSGTMTQVYGVEGEIHGKRDLLNSFLIGVGSNEGSCSQCHIGYGYVDDTFDFTNPENIDCLVCHDQTGTYFKGEDGLPDPGVDLNAVARSVGLNGGLPSRQACLSCHAETGGGDNAKHGDLSSDLVSTTKSFDVHMGLDGQDMLCVDCHGSNNDHGIGGMSLHSVNEGAMSQCVDCHEGGVTVIHDGTTAATLFSAGRHRRLDCRVCHIPQIAKAVSTMVTWNWADAGQDIDPIPVDPVTGRETYDKNLGSFVWQSNVRPTLRYSNGMWQRMIVGSSDRSNADPISLAAPMGNYTELDAMIFPYKKMTGNQPVDEMNNTVLVPHLHGLANGDNPYWMFYDWSLALQDGAAYTGQTYTGSHRFADTTMLLSVNHEIAPPADALGHNARCNDCHSGAPVDWQALGWSADPMAGGTRVTEVVFFDGFE